jgi:Tfp pilus assembly protein PilF
MTHQGEESMARCALVIVVCLLAGGCQASFPEARPLARGFLPTAGVLAPYEDGKLHLAAGRYGVAIERFGQALASDRRSLDALNGLAIAYTRLNRFDVAQGYFERALEIDAFSAPTLNNYGRALIEQGRLRDARPFLQLALHHAVQADLTVVAANLGSMGGTQPSALVAGLRDSLTTPPTASRRLIRLAANRYRLETPGELAARPEQAIVARHPTALDRPLRQQPAGALAASQRQARTEPDAGSSLVLAGGEDGLGIALASAADLEALGPDPDKLATEAQFAVRRAALQARPSAGSRASALASGEPT